MNKWCIFVVLKDKERGHIVCKSTYTRGLLWSQNIYLIHNNWVLIKHHSFIARFEFIFFLNIHFRHILIFLDSQVINIALASVTIFEESLNYKTKAKLNWNIFRAKMRVINDMFIWTNKAILLFRAWFFFLKRNLMRIQNTY